LLGSPCPLLAFNIDDGLYLIEIVKHLFREWPPAATAPMEEDGRFMAFWLHDMISPKIAGVLPVILDIYLVDDLVVDEGEED